MTTGSQTTRFVTALTCMFCAAVLSGCALGPKRPAAPNPQLAMKLHREATQVRDDDPARARELLMSAVNADPFFGPSHNNLGTIYLEEGQRQLAFAEFETARRLMPGDPRPHVNLGMLFASAGQFDNAMREYDDALALHSNFMPAVRQKAWLQVHADQIDETTLPALEMIAIRADDDEWREFGKEWSLRLHVEE